jgi:hypothetical protein
MADDASGRRACGARVQPRSGHARAPARATLSWLAFVALALIGEAHAAAILHARYDPKRDAIVVDIAYRGASAKHKFSVQWSECDRSAGDVPQVSARLIDEQGSEPARKDYRVKRRFSVAWLECRPAMVTLRLGRSFATADVPLRERNRARR